MIYTIIGDLPLRAVIACTLNITKAKAEGIGGMAVHRQSGCPLEDLSGPDGCFVENDCTVCTFTLVWVIDAQFTYASGQVLQIFTSDTFHIKLCQALHSLQNALTPCALLVLQSPFDRNIGFDIVHLENVLAVIHIGSAA